MATEQGWSLLKRAAKMENNTLAKKIMWKYFNTNKNKRIWRGSPKLTLHTSLCRDLKLIGVGLKTVDIVREKLKKCARIYIPKEAHQGGSVLAAAVQLERDGETSTEQQP